MITKQIATSARSGQVFYHVVKRNRDGSALRCRINGKCHTWATKPDDFKLPVKYGLKRCFYITPSNAAEWTDTEPMDPHAKSLKGISDSCERIQEKTPGRQLLEAKVLGAFVKVEPVLTVAAEFNRFFDNAMMKHHPNHGANEEEDMEGL